MTGAHRRQTLSQMKPGPFWNLTCLGVQVPGVVEPRMTDSLLLRFS